MSAAGALERADFIRDVVWRRVGEGSEPPELEIIAHRHGIVEYRFGGGRRVIAKPFLDAKIARAAYGIQQKLWEGGFGPESAHRVPEPIAYLEEERVVLMEAAPGERMRELATGDWPVWSDALRGAAGWLAYLHASPHRLGPHDNSTLRVLHLARRVAQTTAQRPDLEDTLVKLLQDLADRLPAHDRVHAVQTHGRYHPQHVYVSDHVTVIDADRATPGDAAKDVGEFLHRLRSDAMSAGVSTDAADRASALFVEEYRSRSDGDLSALAFYWSYSVLFTLVARAGRAHADDAGAEQRRGFYEDELAAIPARVRQLVPS